MPTLNLPEARLFNVKASKTIWRQADLLDCLQDSLVDSDEFAKMVSVFQASHNLLPDGKLGSATLAVIREVAREEDRDVSPREGVSNAIVVGGKRVSLPASLLALNLSASNYLDDEEVHFKAKARSGQVKHLVIHESVTYDVPTTVRLLSKEGYGVHLMVGPDGHISCHNDLLTEQPIHGNQINSTSVGLEVVNPYTAQKLKPPFTRTIPARWWTWVPANAPKEYTLPTESQMKAVLALIPWVCELLPDLPLAFPTSGLSKKNPRIPGFNASPKAKPGPGVVGHGDYSSHADGRYILEAVIAAQAK